ncbi:phage P22, antirepressor protein [Methylobacterium sp. Leaf123]|uniref:phage antirepressor N-terminal domain-containing protein n=1 Tax=Methylobacterium sp. Leaf123 TaxID=1736264 RepID=UPI0007022C31|nr:phage antirepressor N-terminal domain-containing protein [Methylobacterium sp. Leaf123]KQQ23741.1 phage P22, antirepressor protein [Methylobacterium sp. Leaf123]
MSKLVTINFHDDTLFAVEDGESVFVAVKPISDGLGLKWSGQHDRLHRDPILAEGIRVTRMPTPGGEQETVCLRLDLIQGWLFGIDASRVKADARGRVLAYKRECFAVLFRHFYGERATVARLELAEPAREEPVPVRRSLVTEARQTFGTRAAGSLWLALGLPVVPEMREGRRQTEFGFTYEALPTTTERSA